jgi:hypothetical protein
VWVSGESTRSSRGRETPATAGYFADEAPQGFVVAWRRHSYRYTALVTYVDQTPDGQDQLVQRWIPAEQLRPVRSDPNEAIRYSGFSELLRPPTSDR